MNLTMQMMADRLKEFHPISQISSNSFDINSVRLFSFDVTLEAHTLYVGKMCDLFSGENDRIICAHNNDLIQLDTTDLESVVNQVLNTISYYNEWESKVMALLTGDGMLQDLFDASEKVLGRPVFLLDSAQRHLAHTKQFGIGKVDPFWDLLLEKGSCDMEFLMKFNLYDPHRFARKGIYSYPDPVFPHESYHYNFTVNNLPLGSATYIVQDSPVTQGELDCYQTFCQFLDRWFQLHIQDQENIMLDTQMRTAITNSDADLSDLRRRLLLRNWENTDSLIFYKLDAPLQPFSINTHLAQTLHVTLPSHIVVVSGLSICLLCNTRLESQKEIEEKLLPWLTNSNYYATAGLSFTMKDSFYDHYRYVDVTSDYTEKQVGNIYHAQQYVMPYLLKHLQDTIIPNALHPVLQILKDYDEKHHFNLYGTLYTYLKNNRNIARTAEEMHLHRNTLLYRLNRLKDLVALDNIDYMTQLHIMLSFEIEKQR